MQSVRIGPHPAQRLLGYVLLLTPVALGIWVGLFAELAVPRLWGLIFVGIVGVPMLAFGNQVVSDLRVDESGLTRRAPLTGRTVIPWGGVHSVALEKSWGGIPERAVVVRGTSGRKRTKLAYTSTRTGFRKGTRELVTGAQRHGAPIKTSIINSRAGWSRYLDLDLDPTGPDEG